MERALPTLPHPIKKGIVALFSVYKLFGLACSTTDNFGGGVGAGVGGAIAGLVSAYLGDPIATGLGAMAGGLIGGSWGGLETDSFLGAFMGGLGGSIGAGTGAYFTHTSVRSYQNSRIVMLLVEVTVGAGLGGAFGGFVGPITCIVHVSVWMFLLQDQINSHSIRSNDFLQDFVSILLKNLHWVVMLYLSQLSAYLSNNNNQRLQDFGERYNLALTDISKLQMFLNVEL